MTISGLNYSLAAVARERASATEPVVPAEKSARTPNRRSIAKKRWWAEKKAREAAKGAA